MSDGISTKGLPLIAFATSFDLIDNNQRWTELSLFHRPGERRPFLADSRGCSKVEGEREYKRQRVAKSIEEACRLFDNSRLHDEIITKAQAWADAQPAAPGRQAPAIQFDGAGGLRGALLWLYPDASVDEADSALGKRFLHDFGVPVRTVTHALKQQSDGQGLPSWCLAFIGGLQHFDRDAFYANRRP